MDTRTAADMLEHYASMDVEGLDRRLSRICKTSNWTDQIKVQQFEGPKTWRLVCDSGDETKEEIVLSLQGSIVEKDLPPMLEKPRVNITKYKYLRQSIRISGLGTSTFGDALRSTGEIFGLFDREFRDGDLDSWTATSNQNAEDDIFDASNRYFTPRRDASLEESIPFDKLADPNNILKKMAGDQYVHTEDNEVLYFRRRTTQDGKRSHEKVGPQTFRVGDIVEIQVSFVVVPTKGDRYKMMSVLRSIALIDGAFSKHKSSKQQPEPKASITLKRKVQYEEPADDEEEDRRRKRAMDVDAEGEKA
ncbi:hypothetical protein LshimejAT787_0411610 [Lyophyllum shimeji]|uniref:Uncharacterized protein n=1 Tax=Lyophyllum shimeji TaxID=47721 RepID=A0A9P3UNP8_LYOSH|nr:hypothetical protein LshimejAT787_0411610 [Lyophyllum shimeji]